MDANSEEQTELLREIWKQMVATDRNLTSKIEVGLEGVRSEVGALRLDFGALRSDLGALRSDLGALRSTVELIAVRMQENFARVQRNFDRIDTRLVANTAEHERLEELDTRVTQIELHVGLRRG